MLRLPGSRTYNNNSNNNQLVKEATGKYDKRSREIVHPKNIFHMRN